MFVGARVAYTLSGSSRLGVVTKLGSSVYVQFDGTDRALPINPSYLQLVNYWRDRRKEIPASELKFYPKNTEALDIFRSKQAINFGISTIRGIWHWANLHVFNSRLQEPAFAISAQKLKYGFYQLKRGQRVGTLTLTERNHSMYELFATQLHEMVHQYNFEIDWLQERNFNPNVEGSHGHTFLQWIPKVKAVTGITITVKGDPNSDDTEFADTKDELTTKPFIFALINLNNNPHLPARWVGYTMANERELSTFTAKARQTLRSTGAEDTSVYAGLSKLKRVQGEFNSTQKGNFNPKAIKTLPSAAVVRLAVETGEPVEGWKLPKLNILPKE